MKITESQLRSIIRQEIVRKTRLTEALDLEKVKGVITKNKIKDPDSFKKAMEEFGDEVKDVIKNNVDAIKTAYEEQGGNPKDLESAMKEIVTGKPQVSGDMASAAKAAAKILGNEEIATNLAAVVSILKKDPKKIDSFDANKLRPLAKLALDFIFKGSTDTLAAAKKLAAVGEKKTP